MDQLIFLGLVIIILSACTPSTQSKKEMTMEPQKPGLVEITSFKLNRGVTEKDFEASARAVQKNFMEKQDGFINRTLTVSQDSIWTDVVFWKDQQSIENTMELAGSSELVMDMMEKVDSSSVKMSLTTPVIIKE